MKIAILFHGNLRTFLMPLRENPSMRLCDHSLPRILYPNLKECDVFVATDCNDFFYDGCQYYSDDKRIEIHNNDAFRLFSKIKIESNDKCRSIIENELRKVIPNIKALSIENPFDIRKHERYRDIYEKCDKYKGAQTELLLAQYRKIHQAYELMKEQERKQGFEYDLVFRVRFDNVYPVNHPLILSNYDYTNKVVYVPGAEAGMVYDWFAFGKRENMKPLLELYENLGFTSKMPHWIAECWEYCGKKGVDGELEDSIDPLLIDKGTKKGKLPFCPICKRNSSNVGGVYFADITMSSEYHVHCTLNIHGIAPVAAGYYPIVYRYLSLDTKDKVNDILSTNQANLNGVEFLNYQDNSVYARSL